jgi:hypothetical protein
LDTCSRSWVALWIPKPKRNIAPRGKVDTDMGSGAR